MDFLLSFLLTFLIILITPIIIYGLFSKFLGLKEPDKKLNFFLSVLVQKAGTSLGFVWLFYLARQHFGDEWFIYGLVWFVMFAVVEVGQAIAPTYSKKEAVAGIVSELLYFPLAAFLVAKLIT